MVGCWTEASEAPAPFSRSNDIFGAVLAELVGVVLSCKYLLFRTSSGIALLCFAVVGLVEYPMEELKTVVMICERSLMGKKSMINMRGRRRLTMHCVIDTSKKFFQ